MARQTLEHPIFDQNEAAEAGSQNRRDFMSRFDITEEQYEQIWTAVYKYSKYAVLIGGAAGAIRIIANI